MRAYHLHLFALALVCSGCTFGTWYKEPTTGPTANLRILTKATNSYNIGVVRFPGSHSVTSKGEVLGALNSLAIGVPKVKFISIRVPAGEPFRFQIGSGGNSLEGNYVITGLCFAHMVFVPTEGKNYEAVHSVGRPDGCEMPIFERTGNDMLVPEPTAKRLSTCLDPHLTPSGMKDAQERPAVYCSDDFQPQAM